jgi:7-alpha-hydroxysteroid dehydrogenase
MFSLTGKSCVVTGASRGLGRAIALAFAEQGADVVLAARRVPDPDALRVEIEAKGRRAVVAPTDVTDARSSTRSPRPRSRASGSSTSG